jgi:hypothetical protein
MPSFNMSGQLPEGQNRQRLTSGNQVGDQTEEIRRLKKELDRMTDERDIQKKRPHISPGMQSEVRVRCPASTEDLGADDVPFTAYPPQRLLGAVEWMDIQGSLRREENPILDEYQYRVVPQTVPSSV